MGSDRARVSYGERQHYRSVVMQQGRVTLEADWNESQVIAGEEERHQALDIVGTSGTPDNGYAITFPAGFPAFDFQIGAGTMYVGGVRTAFPLAVQYSQQSDWLDNVLDPDWSPLPTRAPSNEYVYLFLREQEVSAVEDSELRDVALGGPDTAQRTRLIQHVVRLDTDAKDCADALTAAEKIWSMEGLTFDSATMRVKSNAVLQVGFTNPGSSATPCDPVAQGGYLGADNQLIRVQISSVEKARDGSTVTKLVWGYDNASFLYRVDVADPTTLKLQSMPVDTEHQPRSGQTVEILLAAAQLANGEFVAAQNGFVTSLAAAYNPDSQTVSLQSALPAVFGDGNPNDPHPARVYLRVWRQELSFTSGTPVILGDTGVQVTLSTANNAPFHKGDYWMFAVRPSTPQQVYPERYLTAAQPPNGPREWVCPLAVVQWSANGGSVVDDCRNLFDNLVSLSGRKLGGCCTVTIKPSDLTGDRTLQTIVDRYRGSGGVNICFMPGAYSLDQSLNLTAEHSNFTFEACAGGVSFAAVKGAEHAFQQGLVVLNAPSSVTFRGIEFQMPASTVGSTTLGTGAAQQITEVVISIGIRPAGCQGLTIEDCRFVFPATLNSSGQGANSLIAAAIFAAGACDGHRLLRNRFEGQEQYASATSIVSQVGYLLYPSTVSSSISSTAVVKAGSGQVVLPSLENTLFRENVFDGCNSAVLVIADCGQVSMESNTVRNCNAGFGFYSSPTLAVLDDLPVITVPAAAASAGTLLHAAIQSTLGSPGAQLAGAVLRGFPLPSGFDLSSAKSVSLQDASVVLKDATVLQSFFDRTVGVSARASEQLAGAPAPVVKLGDVTTRSSEFAAPIARGQFDVGILNQSYSAFEKLAFSNNPPTVGPLSLRFSDCVADTIGATVSSSFALYVLHFGTDDDDALRATGNMFVGSNVGVALIAGVARCTFTGNIVLNDAIPSTPQAAHYSLVLYPRSVPGGIAIGKELFFSAAVTGNVFRGQAILPARNLIPAPPAPMDTWHFFNSET